MHNNNKIERKRERERERQRHTKWKDCGTFLFHLIALFAAHCSFFSCFPQQVVLLPVSRESALGAFERKRNEKRATWMSVDDETRRDETNVATDRDTKRCYCQTPCVLVTDGIAEGRCL